MVFQMGLGLGEEEYSLACVDLTTLNKLIGSMDRKFFITFLSLNELIKVRVRVERNF